MKYVQNCDIVQLNLDVIFSHVTHVLQLNLSKSSAAISN